MKRREFITLLGGAAAAWPLAARAQQQPMQMIGLLSPVSPNAVVDRLRGFRQGLKETGYVEGENVTIIYRFADNQIDRLPELAADLVQRRVTVIATSGNHVAPVAKAATMTIPIVSLFDQDPVKLGLVASLARPGGNVTGINFISGELSAKRLGLLHELLPKAARIAVLVNPTQASTTELMVRDLEAAAGGLGLQIRVVNATTSQEIDAAFAMLVPERHDALFVVPDPFFASRRVQVVNLAIRNAIPLLATRDFTEIGGLMSYGANIVDAWRQQAVYVGHILKGAKPADLPVVQSIKFELVINGHTARMLGITVPASLLAIADEVIE